MTNFDPIRSIYFRYIYLQQNFTMKKLLLISLITLCIFSCETSIKTKDYPEIQDGDIIKIDTLLSKFKNLHPNINKNDVYYQDAQSDFLYYSKLTMIDSNNVTNIPLKILNIYPSPYNDGRYIIHAEYSPIDTVLTSDVYKYLHIDLFDFTSKEVAMKINQNDTARFKFKNIHDAEQLTEGNLREFTNEAVWSINPKFYLTKGDNMILDNNDYAFGCYKVFSDSVVIATGSKK